MALQAVYEALEDIPEDQKGFYVESEGKFLLDVEGANGYALEDVSGLKAALTEERKNRSEADKRLAKFGGLEPGRIRADLEELKTLRDAVDTSADADEKLKKQLEAQAGKLQAKHETELGKAKDAAKKWRKAHEKSLLDNAVVNAIASNDGNPRLLMGIVRESLKVVESDDGESLRVVVVDKNGDPRVHVQGSEVGEMSPAQFVAELRDDEELGAAFKAPETGGSGSKPTGGGSVGGSELQRILKISDPLERATAMDAFEAQQASRK